MKNKIDTVIVRRSQSDLPETKIRVKTWKALIWRKESMFLGLAQRDVIETAFRRYPIEGSVLCSEVKPVPGSPCFEEGWIYSFLPITGKPDCLLEDIRESVDLNEGELLFLASSTVPEACHYYLDSSVMENGFIKMASESLHIYWHNIVGNKTEIVLAPEDEDKRDGLMSVISKIKDK